MEVQLFSFSLLKHATGWGGGGGGGGGRAVVRFSQRLGTVISGKSGEGKG